MISIPTFPEGDTPIEPAEAFDAGRKAALDGCYRVLACPESEAQRQAWLAGWDAGNESRNSPGDELQPVIIDGRVLLSRELSNPTPADLRELNDARCYIPSPAEIAAACLMIQAEWTVEERMRRGTGRTQGPSYGPRGRKGVARHG